MAFSEVLYVVRSHISITLSLSHLSFLFCLHFITCMEKFFVLMKIFLFHLFYVGCIRSSRGLLEHQCLKCLPLNRSCQCGHAIMCTRGGLEHSTQVCLFSHLFYLLNGGLSLFLSRVLMEVNALNLSAWRVQGWLYNCCLMWCVIILMSFQDSTHHSILKDMDFC
jgi:hypothetical protein